MGWCCYRWCEHVGEAPSYWLLAASRLETHLIDERYAHIVYAFRGVAKYFLLPFIAGCSLLLGEMFF